MALTFHNNVLRMEVSQGHCQLLVKDSHRRLIEGGRNIHVLKLKRKPHKEKYF